MCSISDLSWDKAPQWLAHVHDSYTFIVLSMNSKLESTTAMYHSRWNQRTNDHLVYRPVGETPSSLENVEIISDDPPETRCHVHGLLAGARLKIVKADG